MNAVPVPAISDEDRLKCVVVTLLGVPDADYGTSNIKKALDAAGVRRFNAHFITLSEQDLNELYIPGTGRNAVQNATILDVVTRRLLKTVLAIYHSISVANVAPCEICKVTKDMFDDFRISDYDPNESIVQWSTTVKKNNQGSKELEAWQKNVKPVKSDYKDFRDEANWTRYKEKFCTTLESHGLEHMIDPAYVPNDDALDYAQTCWLYKVFQDVMIAPMAKTIVNDNSSTKDVRLIWKQICEAYDNSIASEIKSQTLAGFLTQTRLSAINWRGTKVGFISYWQEQFRLYNEISQEEFTEGQGVQFLNQALYGIEGLDNVLSLNRTARQANGLPTHNPSFSDYVYMLLDAAQTLDAQKGLSNTRSRRSVNKMESYPDHEDSHYQLEAEVHDIETPVEQFLVMQMDNSMRKPQETRRPKLNFKTWKILEDSDKKAWDVISDKGKTAIIAYAGERANNGFATQRRSVNNHEMIFDEIVDNSTVEVSMHHLEPFDEERLLIDNSKPAPDVVPNDDSPVLHVSQADFTSHTTSLLNMAVNKTVLSDVPLEETGVNIHEYKDIDIHDILSSRSDYTPVEINSHELHYPDSDDEDKPKNPFKNDDFILAGYQRKVAPSKSVASKKSVKSRYQQAQSKNSADVTAKPVVNPVLSRFKSPAKISTSAISKPYRSRRPTNSVRPNPKYIMPPDALLPVPKPFVAPLNMGIDAKPNALKTPKTEFMSGKFRHVTKPSEKPMDRLRRERDEAKTAPGSTVKQLDLDSEVDGIITDNATTGFPSTERDMIAVLMSDSVSGNPKMTQFSIDTMKHMTKPEIESFFLQDLSHEQALSAINRAKAYYNSQDATLDPVPDDSSNTIKTKEVPKPSPIPVESVTNADSSETPIAKGKGKQPKKKNKPRSQSVPTRRTPSARIQQQKAQVNAVTPQVETGTPQVETVVPPEDGEGFTPVLSKQQKKKKAAAARKAKASPATGNVTSTSSSKSPPNKVPRTDSSDTPDKPDDDTAQDFGQAGSD